MSKPTTYIVSGFVKGKVMSKSYSKLKYAVAAIVSGEFPKLAKEIQIHSTSNGKLNLVNRNLKVS